MPSPPRPPGRRHHLPTVVLLSLLLAATAVATACSDDAGLQQQNLKPPATPEPLTPRGPVSLPITFTWKTVPGDWVYRVIVTDEAERVLLEQDSRNRSSYPLSGELHAMMVERRGTFHWSIAIVAPDGHLLAQSVRVPFSLK
jgi:hypothetical protein